MAIQMSPETIPPGRSDRWVPSGYRTVINPDQFPSGPINITGFTWRAAPGKGALNVTFSGGIYLSTSPNWANSTGHPLMSTTYANNVGSDNTLVMSPGNFTLSLLGCAGPGPCPFANNITFTTPFPYNKANGPLLIDLQLTAASASGTGGIRCHNLPEYKLRDQWRVRLPRHCDRGDEQRPSIRGQQHYANHVYAGNDQPQSARLDRFLVRSRDQRTGGRSRSVCQSVRERARPS